MVYVALPHLIHDYRLTSIADKRTTEKESVVKTTSLFQLGGVAVLLAAILYAIGNLMYFLSGQPEAPALSGLWIAFCGDTLLVFGLGALFAWQSQQGGLLGLVGYVLLVVATMFFVGSYAVSLGVAAGVISNEQIAQVPAYTVSSSIMPWIWFVGLIAFGVSIYRAHVFPKYAGALLVLLAIVQQLTSFVGFVAPIFAILSVVAWAWLGWSLLSDKRLVSRQPIPAT
jgi:hypothetical protein